VAISIICELPAKPDSVDALRTFLQEVLPDTRSYPGCIEMRVVQEQNTPERFVIIERWATKEDHLSYLQWRGGRNEIKPAYQWLTSEPRIDYFDESDV
jgi:quinol monooxygenase YgiN